MTHFLHIYIKGPLQDPRVFCRVWGLTSFLHHNLVMEQTVVMMQTAHGVFVQDPTSFLLLPELSNFDLELGSLLFFHQEPKLFFWIVIS